MLVVMKTRLIFPQWSLLNFRHSLRYAPFFASLYLFPHATALSSVTLPHFLFLDLLIQLFRWHAIYFPFGSNQTLFESLGQRVLTAQMRKSDTESLLVILQTVPELSQELILHTCVMTCCSHYLHELPFLFNVYERVSTLIIGFEQVIHCLLDISKCYIMSISIRLYVKDYFPISEQIEHMFT